MWNRIRLVAAGVVAVGVTAGAATLAQAQPPAAPAAQATPTATPTRPANQGGRGAIMAGRIDEYLNRLAANLGVAPDTLRDALRQTAIQEIDAAVARGEIPADRAQQFKDRIQSGQRPPLGPRAGGPTSSRMGGGMMGGIVRDRDALATFLGITRQQLQDEIKGKSLAQVAQSHGKTRAQLIQFLTDQANTQLNQAIENGRITQPMADRIRQNQQPRIERMVDRIRQEDGPAKPRRDR